MEADGKKWLKMYMK